MFGDGIKQTTATTGTGNLTVASVSGFPTLADVFGVGPPISYSLVDSSGQPVEMGVGYLSATTTFVRAWVSATYVSGTYTNVGATAVSLSGTTTVICTPHASTVQAAPQTVDSFSSGVGRYVASSGTTNLRTTYLLGATMFYIPFQSDFGCVANAMALNVTTAVAGNATLGIYACNHQSYPGKLLASTAAFSVGTTGWKKPALTANLAMNPGFYFIGLSCPVAITITASESAGYNTQAGPNPFGFVGDSFTSILFRVGGAAMPADASAVATTGISAVHCPAILIGVV